MLLRNEAQLGVQAPSVPSGTTLDHHLENLQPFISVEHFTAGRRSSTSSTSPESTSESTRWNQVEIQDAPASLALRRASSSCGAEPVLNDADVDHCASFAISFADITLGVVIGEGAGGFVQQGVLKGHNVAIKRMKCPVGQISDQQEVRDLIREISIMCRNFSTLNHPNVVGFHGICIDNTMPWLIIEWMGAGSVEEYCQAQRIGQKRWTPERKRALVSLDLARGLDFVRTA